LRIVRIFDNLNLLTKSAANFVYREMQRILTQTGEISFIISGDLQLPSFFLNLQRKFKEKQLPLFDIYWFSANESWVASMSALNREYRLRESLFNLIRPAEENIFSWQVMQLPPYRCAERFNTSIQNHFIVTGKRPGITLLTMDEDGNIASLFPGSKALVSEQQSLPLTPEINLYSAAIYSKERWYMSLTPQLINLSETVIIFVIGADKQKAFKHYLSGDKKPSLGWLQNKNIFFYLTKDVGGDYIYHYTKQI